MKPVIMWKERWSEDCRWPVPGQHTHFSEENTVNLKSRDYWSYHSLCKDPKGLVFLFHGWGCHSNTLAFLAERLNSEGFSCFGLDQLGHGKTTKSFFTCESSIEDSGHFVELIKSQYDWRIPVFLVGVDLGALICLNLALTLGVVVKGVVLISPLLELSWNPSCFIVSLRSCCLPLPKDTYSLHTRNENSVDFMASDNLLDPSKLNYTNREELNKLIRLTVGKFSIMKFRVLVIHGGSDKVTDLSAVKQFVQEIPSKNKLFLLYNNMFHGAVYEPEIHDIREKVALWLSNSGSVRKVNN